MAVSIADPQLMYICAQCGNGAAQCDLCDEEITFPAHVIGLIPIEQPCHATCPSCQRRSEFRAARFHGHLSHGICRSCATDQLSRALA